MFGRVRLNTPRGLFEADKGQRRAPPPCRSRRRPATPRVLASRRKGVLASSARQVRLLMAAGAHDSTSGLLLRRELEEDAVAARTRARVSASKRLQVGRSSREERVAYILTALGPSPPPRSSSRRPGRSTACRHPRDSRYRGPCKSPPLAGRRAAAAASR